MSKHYHIRVCAIGTEDDINGMLYGMLIRYGAMEEDTDGLTVRLRREELLNKVYAIAKNEGAPSNGFLYHMLCPVPYGSADVMTSTLTVRQEPCGEWSACFDYHSTGTLQNDDWLWLHMHSNMLQMVAQYACDDFGMEKGRLLISGGKAMDNWSCMAEVWFWLTSQYAAGETPEGVVEKLTDIAKALQREDYDMNPEELLCACENNLRMLEEWVALPDTMRQQIEQAKEANDWGTVSSVRVAAAEAVLWEIDHNPKWMAGL